MALCLKQISKDPPVQRLIARLAQFSLLAQPTMPRIEYRLEEARCESAGTIRLLKPLVGLIFAQCINSIVSAVYFTAHHLAVSAEPVTKRYPQ